MQNLAAYIIRASFSQTRMEYFPEQAKVTYRSKYGHVQKTYDALEWLAAWSRTYPSRANSWSSTTCTTATAHEK